MLTYLYGGNTGTSRQIQQFFTPGSSLFLGNLNHLPKLIGGHSYFTESNDSTTVAVRRQLADTAKKHGITFWETEYSMLADGYKDGSKERRTAMDCALFLAKIIHNDLTVANAAAWQFWNAYEPGRADFNTRYYLIALNPKPDFKDGEFTVTKNLWVLGHYSLFVRPGMERIAADLPSAGKNIMVSAYKDKNNKLVLVCINYGANNVTLKLDLKNAKKKYQNLAMYLTTADKDIDMKAMPAQNYLKPVSLPARAISTILVN
jgi:O-glycosyl hydrolase